MQASFKEQLKVVMNSVNSVQVKPKEQRHKKEQPCLQANKTNQAFIWRITRNKDRFDRFDVIETCSNSLIWSSLDLDEAQDVVELHNQQVEKWWEIKEVEKKMQHQASSFN